MMGSLSTTAGTVSPKSFMYDLHHSEYFWTEWVPKGADPPRTSGLTLQHVDGRFSSYHGRMLKDFHKRKNSGELLPQTHYTRIDNELKKTAGVLSWEDSKYSYYRTNANGEPFHQISGCYEAFSTNSFEIALSTLGIDPKSAVQNAAAKIYSQGWDVATFLAEFHLTVKMFRKVCTNFLGLLDSLSKDVRTIRAYDWNRPLSTWLEGRYGWRILAYDIRDINHLIESLDDPARTRVKDRAGFSRSTSTTEQLQSEWSWCYTDVLLSRDLDCSVRGTIVADFVPSRILANPVTTAWELTTLSFVVDWIYGVGQALNAMSFVAFSTSYTASYGLAVSLSRTMHSSSFIPIAPHPDNISFEQSSEFTCDAFRRVPCTVPLLPQVNVNLNAFKVMDLVALVGQAVFRFLNARR